MKRIFHFVKSNNLSGLENVVINICTMVKGYDYTYISTQGPIDDYLRNFGIKHIVIPKFDPINIYKIIKKYRPDIVQAHDARASVFMAFSALFCKRHHIKMISELHNNDPKMSQWWRLRTILYAFASHVYKTIISVSPNIPKNYAYPHLLSNKVKIITNVVSPSRIKNGLDNKNYKTWDCMFLGRMADQKDPIKFVKIISQAKIANHNIKAIMVGNGKLMNNVKFMVNKYGLQNNIQFVGFQSNPYKYIQHSKILVITSKYEGIPLVALETMIVNTPIVSTPLPVLKQVLGNSGIFNSNNNILAKNINKLLYNNKEYILKKRLEKIRINKINNVDNFISKYNLIYNGK